MNEKRISEDENDSLLIQHYETLIEISKTKVDLTKRNLKLEIDTHHQKKQDCLEKLDELQKQIEKLTKIYETEKEYQESLEFGKKSNELQKSANQIFL